MVCELLLIAIMAVETGGCQNPLEAEGDYWNGQYNSIGCMQIQKCVIEDVNRVYKTNFIPEDRLKQGASFRIARLYLEYWGKHYEKKTGNKATNEILARIWNGGPYGWKKTGKAKANLDKYWAKVKRELERG